MKFNASNTSHDPMLGLDRRPLNSSPVRDVGVDVDLSMAHARDPITDPPNIGGFEKGQNATTAMGAG